MRPENGIAARARAARGLGTAAAGRGRCAQAADPAPHFMELNLARRICDPAVAMGIKLSGLPVAAVVMLTIAPLIGAQGDTHVTAS